LLENDSFSIYIEYEPHVRELVEAYMASKFSTVLELLERYSVGSIVATLDRNADPVHRQGISSIFTLVSTSGTSQT